MLFNKLYLLNLTELYVEDLNDYENFKKAIHMSAINSCLLDYFYIKKFNKHRKIIHASIWHCIDQRTTLFLIPISI